MDVQETYWKKRHWRKMGRELEETERPSDCNTGLISVTRVGRKVLDYHSMLTKSPRGPWAIVTCQRGTAQALAGSNWGKRGFDTRDEFQAQAAKTLGLVVGDLRGTFSCETWVLNDRITQMIIFLLYTFLTNTVRVMVCAFSAFGIVWEFLQSRVLGYCKCSVATGKESMFAVCKLDWYTNLLNKLYIFMSF